MAARYGIGKDTVVKPFGQEIPDGFHSGCRFLRRVGHQFRECLVCGA